MVRHFVYQSLQRVEAKVELADVSRQRTCRLVPDKGVYADQSGSRPKCPQVRTAVDAAKQLGSRAASVRIGLGIVVPHLFHIGFSETELNPGNPLCGGVWQALKDSPQIAGVRTMMNEWALVENLDRNDVGRSGE
jgi:hypothetical protein